VEWSTVSCVAAATVTDWDAIGDPPGDGLVQFANTFQTMDWNTPDTATTTDGMVFQFNHDASTDALTQRGVVIERVATAGTATLEVLLQIDNSDTDGLVGDGISITTAAGAMTNGINFTPTGVITTAINASDPDIVTALAVGANAITSSDGVTVDFGGNSSTLEIPSGASPTANDPGEVAHDTTANQLVLDDHIFDPRRMISIVVESPVDADHITIMKLPFGITITDIHCIVDPADSAESIQIDIEECNATADSCVDVDASTITCDNDGAEDDGTCTDCVIDAADWIALDMASAPTGTITTLTVSVYYTITRE